MDRSRTIAPVIMSLALAALLSAACDSGTQEPAAPTEASPAHSSSADEDASAATQAEVDEKIAAIPESRYIKDLPEGVEAAIPDNLPKDLPIYPGSAPAQGRGAEVEGKPMAAVQLLTVDSPDEVFGYYKETLEVEGWVIEDRPELSGKQALAASKDGCKATMLIAPADDGGSDIFVVSECE